MILLLYITLAVSHWRYAHHGHALLPNAGITPGAVDAALTKEVLCAPGYHTAQDRNVPLSEKKAACREYALTAGCPGKGYEIDHLVSIELGGSNAITNLWPQPADRPGLLGFHTKDVVEDRAHRAVCQGKLPLADAQKQIAGDWYAFGLKNGFFTP